MTYKKGKMVFPTLAIFFAVTLLFVTVPGNAYAETDEEKIEKIGQQGIQLEKEIKNEKNPQRSEELQDEMDDLKRQMQALGVPTVEEYESNKAFWRNMAVQSHIAEEEKNNQENLNPVDYQEIKCTNNCTPTKKISKFQSGYAYDCYVGIWTCHAYAPIWKYLEDGESTTQKLVTGNPHKWIDPFWLVSGNQAMNITYTYQYVLYNAGGTQRDDDSSGDVQRLYSSNTVRTVDMDRWNNPTKGYIVDNHWTINSIS